MRVSKFAGRKELQWDKKEETRLCSRILKLYDDQIGAIAHIVAGFDRKDIQDVVADIRRHREGSGHLPIIIFEAKSKEDLLWWIDYFEKAGASRY